MALQLTEEDVARAVSDQMALAAARDAHSALSSGEAVNVVRTRARTPKLSLHTMSAASPELGYAAAKVYTATARGMQSYLLLFASPGGDLLALIEANELGRLRTAAVSLLAATMLAPLDAGHLAIIGAGYQAEGLLRLYLGEASPFKFRKATIFSRSEENRLRLAGKFKGAAEVDVSAEPSAAAALDGAEVVITATTSSEPVLSAEMLTAARHISAAGSNSLARRELPPRVITGAAVVAVDSKEEAAAESGDLLAPLENGKLNWQQILELGDIITGKVGVSLPAAGGYTLFCSQGLAVQDLFLAAKVYESLR